MHVLILGDPDDGHVELVIKFLTVPYTIINTAAVRDGLPLSFRTPPHRKTVVTYNGKVLPDITAVWCKRLAIEFDHAKFKIDKRYEDYCQKAVRDFIGSLSVSFKDAFWISPYYLMLRAANKQYSIQVAKQLGLLVPDTLMTSDPTAAQEFVNGQATTIVKPFIPKLASRENGGGKYFFAAKLKKDEPVDLSTLAIAPVIFQTAIDQACDVRVFVVKDRLFAASITGKETAGQRQRDWRMSQFDGSMEVAVHELPAQIARKCITLVKQVGLAYGAIDLLLDKSDRYWFLEVNTTGAWRFIEDRTGQPIAKAIAELLNTAGKI